jgi:hypothetical protein
MPQSYVVAVVVVAAVAVAAVAVVVVTFVKLKEWRLMVAITQKLRMNP